MSKCQSIVDFTNENIDIVVTNSESTITIAFYKKNKNIDDDLVLQLTTDKFDMLCLPDMINNNLNRSTTVELASENLALENEKEKLEQELLVVQANNERLSNLVEEYDENIEEYKEKMNLSNSPF